MDGRVHLCFPDLGHGGGGRTSCSPYITCKRLILKDVNKAMDI